jgi:hypothetical protein
MSGSSSSGRGFGGGIPMDIPLVNCLGLELSTRVMSPVMSYFSKSTINTILKIKLDNSTIVLLDRVDDVVGSVYPPKIDGLIKCLEDGHEYIAEIVSITGAQIDITIRAK